ncbi:hypothetical protein SAMN05421678_106252 [Actinopolymorpha cephalotaxi]|uniref:DUF4272 domain-containing protein n=1 Tax=Actinopolymorpha cephalotaxi TaxID=504797 RepID=A0A1I2SSY2_9ACTN|nr:hypothetical protein [Actinopolymorpha cephalotaxi]NYH84001.1 hypothetical protein [Actinopolymorpha cephalotaxi]SFG53011.1 hypothetical protein SAMN05421678_106252 [Actinopolymorpha cephalotaxi]
MAWFAGVPLQLDIVGTRFWMASEALDAQEDRRSSDPSLHDQRGERPGRDWAAVGLFLLARVQLDQLVEILDREFGIQAGAFSGAEVARRLGTCFDEADDLSAGDDLSYEIDTVGEAVDLWRALRAAEGRMMVRHGFAPDGSITITTGPDLPELEALGLRGSESGELEATPTEVLDRASSCTLAAARLAVMRRHRERQQAGVKEEGAGSERTTPEVEHEDGPKRLRALEQAAKSHFSVWWIGSEDAFVEWAVGTLQAAGLVAASDDVSEARAAACLMSLWALHCEFNAYGDGHSAGDWRHDVGTWVDDGITTEHLRTLNSVDQLGWELDDPDFEAPFVDVCANVVKRYSRDVAGALLNELGDSLTFAYFWATRSEDVDYPLSPELVHEIVNDESVLFDDPHSKLPAFDWVQSGMHL